MATSMFLVSSASNKTIVAIRLCFPAALGRVMYRNWDEEEEEEDGKLTPVVAGDEQLSPKSLKYFCPSTALEFKFEGADGPSWTGSRDGDSSDPDDSDASDDDVGVLSWVVEVRSRPYDMKPWEARWAHLVAHGVLSMEVLCADERMQLRTVNDMWCDGVEFAFDVDWESGTRTRVKLTPEVCDKYHPGLTTRLSSDMFWKRYTKKFVEKLYADEEAEEAAAAAEAAVAAAKVGEASMAGKPAPGRRDAKRPRS